MKKCSVFLVTTLLFAVTANAAVQPSEREISIFGNYIHVPSSNYAGSSDGYGGGLGIAEFITNEVSVGLQGWLNWSDDGIIGDVGVNAKYHFCPMEEITPYVGAQVGYAFITTTSWGPHADGMLWGPLVGLRCNVADKTSLFVEYQWQTYCGEVRSYFTESSAIMVGIACGF
jgi:hypothetical protein